MAFSVNKLYFEDKLIEFAKFLKTEGCGMDIVKTGTLTKDIFEVQEVVTESFDKNLLLEFVAVLESNSTHPIAGAIVKYVDIKNSKLKTTDVEEISGRGIKGEVEKHEVLAGNIKLLDKYQIPYAKTLKQNTQTILLVAIDENYTG